MGAAPALAKDIAGAEPAGEAEKAATARPEALMSRAQDKAVRGREVKMPPQEGKCTHKPLPEALPQKGERKPEAPPQKGEREADVLLQNGEHEHKALPQGGPNEGKL